MEQIYAAADILDVVRPHLENITDTVVFTSFIGTLIDEWGAINDKPTEEILNVASEVASVQKDVYASLGRADYVRG